MTRAMRRRSSSDDRGFSLIELLVAMVISTLTLGAVAGIVTTVFKSNKKVQAHVDVVRDLQLAMDVIIRDVRTADPLTAATATSVTVQVQRSGACTLVTYASVASAAASSNGYTATGYALQRSTATCAAPTVVTSSRLLLRAIPAGSNLFVFYTKDGVTIGPPSGAAFASQNDRDAVTRVVVTLQAKDSSGIVQTLSTSTDVRNAPG